MNLESLHLSRRLTRQHSNKILHRDLVPPIIHLNVLSVQVQQPRSVVEHGGWKLVPRVAGDVVGEHENDVGVWDTEALDGAIHGESVGDVAVVEPEAGRTY